MNINQTLAELYSHESKGWQLGLERVEELLAKIGDPHKNLKCIHVAGTNGKGSVCAFIASILEHAGFRIGLYASPHLIKFNERIRINGKCISDKEIIEYYLKIKKKSTDMRVSSSHSLTSRGFFSPATFFEITTAMAFLYFKKKKVDFLVLEVGLGGRLDATNVVKPLVSIITNISLEHQDYLGNTIEKIAYEKAGVIKENIPVMTACKGVALGAIKKVAKEKNAHVYIAKKATNANSILNIGEHKNLKLGLKGNFQFQNAAIALTTIDILKSYYHIMIPEIAIKKGLANAKWHGRFEFVKKNILVDCAHNPDGIKTLAKEIKKLKYGKLILIIGILKDKNIKVMLDVITPLADNIIFTKANISRAEEPEELARYVRKNFIITHNVKEALQKWDKLASKNNLLLITGSIYVVGEAFSLIK